MKTTTQDRFGDHKISQTLGLIMGNSVQSRSIVPSIVGVIKSIFGGEVEEYTRLLTSTRDAALKKLIRKAEVMGADGIVGVRFTTSHVFQGVTEILAFGTAVRFEEE